MINRKVLAAVEKAREELESFVYPVNVDFRNNDGKIGISWSATGTESVEKTMAFIKTLEKAIEIANKYNATL